MSASWKVTLPCTRAEAEALKDDIAVFASMDAPPVLMTSEPDPAQPDDWRLDAYFSEEPDANLIRFLKSLVPSARGKKARIEELEEKDWVALSQEGLEPIRAGPFFVHTPAHRDAVPDAAIAFEIDAGRAFGTGQHETTSGCLIALDRLKSDGATFSNLLDLGTGTGLLGFAAMRLWPIARGAASDIDPVAVEVARDNAVVNGIALGRARGRLELVTAPGLAHPRLKARAPYDLIIANILAQPLIAMAPDIARALRPGGRLILAGLLAGQAARVKAAYRRQGLRLVSTIMMGEWPTLVLMKRRDRGKGRGR